MTDDIKVPLAFPDSKAFTFFARFAIFALGLMWILVPVLFFSGKIEWLKHDYPYSIQEVITLTTKLTSSIALMVFYVWTIRINWANKKIFFKLLIFPGIFYAIYSYLNTNG